MGIAAGTVIAGKVQLEGVSLPEGSAFTVLTPDATGDLFLDAEDEALVLETIAEVARGETISPKELFARLDQRATQWARSFASRSAQRTRDNEFVVLRFWPSQQLKQPRV
jgi:hypothetical protein